MADTKLISKIPDGPLAEKWSKRKAEIRIVSPNNKRKLEVIVVGTGASAERPQPPPWASSDTM